MIELQENVDYKFDIDPSEDSSFVNIQLLSGKFSGVVYKYGKVSLKEDEENDEAHLIFGFDIVDQIDHFNLEENLEFKNHIGEILTAIMVKQMNQ